MKRMRKRGPLQTSADGRCLVRVYAHTSTFERRAGSQHSTGTCSRSGKLSQTRVCVRTLSMNPDDNEDTERGAGCIHICPNNMI